MESNNSSSLETACNSFKERYSYIQFQDIPPRVYKHSRRKGEVWRFFKKTDAVSAIGIPKYSCIFCSFVMVANAARFKDHVSKLCEKVPDDIRKDFIDSGHAEHTRGVIPKVPQMKTEKKASKRIQKSRALYSDDEFPDFDAEDDLEDKDRVVKILTGLLGGKQCRESAEKQPLTQMTDDQLERELKELAVKKARLEVDALEEAKAEREARTYVWQKVGFGFDRLLTAVEMFIAERDNAKTSGAITIDPSEIVEAQVVNEM